MGKASRALELLAGALLLALLVPVSSAAQTPTTPPSLSLSPSVVDEDAGQIVLTITQNGPASSFGDPTYDLLTVDVTATAGQDYVAINRRGNLVTHPIRGTISPITITITDDDVYEGNETFIVRLTPPPAGSQGAGSIQPLDHVVTIRDNEAPTGPDPVLSEISNHLIAQSEALLEIQPRLADHAANSGSDASGSSGRQEFWGEATFARSGSDGIADGDHLVASFGAHGRVSDNAFLGGMLQFDRTGTKLDGDGRSGKISGKGWMAGPYFVARDPSNSLHFEGRLLYGRSSNDVEGIVSAAGTGARNGSFDGERWLAQARIAGEYPLGSGMIMHPLADLGHARNAADGIAGAGAGGADLADEIRTEVSKLRLGTEFEIPLDPAKGDLVFRPGLYFVVTDRDRGGFGASERASSGRVDLGIDYRLDDGVSLGFQGYYSGLGGESEIESYGAGLGLRMQF